jgi:diacylglycerol O-acyltransferase / wax synthase
VSDRLSPLDVSFLYLEEPTAVMHVGSVAIFHCPDPDFALDSLVGLVRDRIAYLPRYRQRVRMVPWRLGPPVWVDDEKFDLNFHVRHSALASPGGPTQLAEVVARIQARPLSRNRPLWELYLVEGLADNQFAIITKTHQALVDGIHAVDIAQLLLDDSPRSVEPRTNTWSPAPEPTDVELIFGAVATAFRGPEPALGALRAGLQDVAHTSARVTQQSKSIFRALARTATRPAPSGPLNVQLGEQRRFAMLDTELLEHRDIRRQHSRPGQAELTVNDVVLAVISGGLRSWLLSRGEPVEPATVIRALVPVSVHSTADEDAAMAAAEHSAGREIAGFVIDLPVGEPSAVLRLQQVAYAMRAQAESGRAIRAQTLVNMAGFAPPTLHSLGARVASAASRRLTNLTISRGSNASGVSGDAPSPWPSTEYWYQFLRRGCLLWTGRGFGCVTRFGSARELPCGVFGRTTAARFGSGFESSQAATPEGGR